MIPLSDDNSQRRTVPVINYLLILVNLAVFLYQVSLNELSMNNFMLRYSVIPGNISSGQDFYTLITSQFLHGGWLHIGGNMLYLWIFGDNIEDAFGHIPYLVFYLACGILAGLAQVVVNPTSPIPSLGASGAIAGVLGAYLVLYPRARVNTLIFLGFFFFWTRLTALLVIGFWAVLQFFNGYTQITHQALQTGGDGVGYFAHIGGFVAGVLVGIIARRFIQQPSAYIPPNWSGRQGPWGGYGPRN